MKLVERLIRFIEKLTPHYTLVHRQGNDLEAFEVVDNKSTQVDDVLFSTPNRADAVAYMSKLGESRFVEASEQWTVWLNGKVFDRVTFVAGMSAVEVRRALIDHDGYDPNITVDQSGSEDWGSPDEFEEAKVREDIHDFLGPITCPACGSKRIYSYGQTPDVVMYTCIQCDHDFSIKKVPL